MITEIEAWNQSHSMKATLIVSINRTENSTQALESVKLAIEMKHRGVVGIDLSGKPEVGTFDTWLEALHLARQNSLKITLHIGEVVNDQEIEVRYISKIFQETTQNVLIVLICNCNCNCNCKL